MTTRSSTWPPRQIDSVLVAFEVKNQADAGADNEFFLYLPQVVAEQARLALGGIVTARPRPYGTEFAQRARGETKQAFYLVLADDWYRELPAKAVQL